MKILLWWPVKTIFPSLHDVPAETAWKMTRPQLHSPNCASPLHTTTPLMGQASLVLSGLKAVVVLLVASALAAAAEDDEQGIELEAAKDEEEPEIGATMTCELLGKADEELAEMGATTCELLGKADELAEMGATACELLLLTMGP